MSRHGAPPVVPDQFKPVLIADIDRLWQKNFTIIWTSVLAFFVLISLPHLIRSIRNGRAFKGVFGVSESWGEPRYQALSSGSNETISKGSNKRPVDAFVDKFLSICWWSLPGLELTLGQVVILGGYIVAVLTTIMTDANLNKNSNRSGFIAVAQLPVVFLFATKNSALSLILGPGHGYEKLNYIHKWAGRCIFIASTLHGVLWIQNHKKTDMPILGELKETTGIAAFGVLSVMVLTSLRPFRRWFYEVFNIIHILAFVSFYITLCYHTPNYIGPYFYPPLAFYGLDLLMRMFRVRIKDAILVPPNSQLTLIHIPDCTDGWVAGQHIRLRVFSSGRIFEAHPLTIFSAPPGLSCITSFPSGINLGARVMGDWTKALNAYARDTGKLIKEQEKECEKESKGQGSAVGSSDIAEVPVQVMFDGPYGGCSLDLGRYETVLLFAGGAGATFTIGLLDDIVGRCVTLKRRGGEITKRIEFAWCIRSFGSLDWFAPALMDIAKVAESSDLALHISVYVTCLCNPEAVPPIPNCDVTIVRPTIYKVLVDLVTPPTQTSASKLSTTSGVVKRPSTAITAESSATEDVDNAGPAISSRLPWVGLEGGIALCASGPEGLTREAANAVARLQLSKNIGPVGVHTEVFGL
ncbi:ferric reductase-like transmembrane component/FAD binding protein [Coprinopsis marcescibilis]|uniref:ferric-chelate reductase (NADPH) n=1 Tax=Coprinopsis marcescibilis TaxID=230819 RepID=A0A5C3L086_COPMA|nr:ferric reductase-like transmembrane component/FAD binding protein [Coprinopsis marcescibilis]